MQFLDVFNYLPGKGKIIFLFVMILLCLWVYFDAEKRGISGLLWAGIVFLFPMVFPVYLIIRPKYFIAFCKNCYRILPRDSINCYFCKKGIPLERDYPPTMTGFFRRWVYQVFLDITRTYHQIVGIGLFFFKKKFLMLNIKLLSFYSWGTCHQLVATEGPNIDIPIDTLTYGETPFLSAWKIFALASLDKKDVFYDLGSGTGHIVFFCNILYGIKSVGIDAITGFIDYSNKIKEALSFDNVTFWEGNFLDADFSEGTVFFIVSTVFDPVTRAELAEKFKTSPVGTRIITVTHIMDVPHLKVIGKGRVFFSWGYEDVYLHVRT
ncbi:MAG TPA: methyltransferase domain-containing protein [Candidatus Eremiobacteraeota bacterium]|nr:methyltransferase domain-containing protein [Candidatus Eremiobacteraeota bacterium]